MYIMLYPVELAESAASNEFSKLRSSTEKYTTRLTILARIQILDLLWNNNDENNKNPYTIPLKLFYPLKRLYVCNTISSTMFSVNEINLQSK